MAKPETTASSGETNRPPAPALGQVNGWSFTGGQKPNGLRDKEIVEVTNDPSDPVDLYRGEQNLMPWSEWVYWRRHKAAPRNSSLMCSCMIGPNDPDPKCAICGGSGEWHDPMQELVEAHIAEAVDHPAHYNAHPSGIECIDVVRHMNFNLGNVVKYVWRAGEKDPTKHLQDLKKARWYLDDEIERLSK